MSFFGSFLMLRNPNACPGSVLAFWAYNSPLSGCHCFRRPAGVTRMDIELSMAATFEHHIESLVNELGDLVSVIYIPAEAGKEALF